MYEVFDDTTASVLLAVESGDSIRRVAQRIHTPYETVRQAVNRLEAAGFVRYDDGLYLTDGHIRTAARKLLAASARISPPSIDDAYVLPQFADRPFAFTRIDAVYVWTRGGYQVGRSPDDYPLFLAVRDRDVEYWEAFLDAFGLPTALERRPPDAFDDPLQVVLEPRADLDVEWVDGHPVVPLQDTVAYASEHSAQFQPALSMLDDEYDLGPSVEN
jgi:DNA-binding Lrp family transcriptional regulator